MLSGFPLGHALRKSLKAALLAFGKPSPSLFSSVIPINLKSKLRFIMAIMGWHCDRLDCMYASPGPTVSMMEACGGGGGLRQPLGFELDKVKLSIQWDIEGQGNITPLPFSLCYQGWGVFPLSH